jgi:multicomponent Na+:H+ antiporter subunit D
VRIINILFIFGLAGMIMGSVGAIREKTIRRMIAYSSVAQIGYIYMGFGLGTDLGMVASVFHILSHALTKSLLFVAASGITAVSGKRKDFDSLTGAGYRNPLAGVAFTVGSLSMIGFPLLAGFISKLTFAEAALGADWKMIPTMIALVISTVLNAIYFMKTVIRIYTPAPEMEKERGYIRIKPGEYLKKDIALIVFIILNFVFGILSSPILKLIEDGLHMFG